jgi:hypothetical protein
VTKQFSVKEYLITNSMASMRSKEGLIVVGDSNKEFENDQIGILPHVNKTNLNLRMWFTIMNSIKFLFRILLVTTNYAIIAEEERISSSEIAYTSRTNIVNNTI